MYMETSFSQIQSQIAKSQNNKYYHGVNLTVCSISIRRCIVNDGTYYIYASL